MDPKVRKKIINDWNVEFPILSNFTPSILLLRADPFLMGLSFEFSGLPGDKDYRAFFNLYPLWMGDYIQTRTPLLCRMALRERVNLHDYYYERNLESMRTTLEPFIQTQIPIDECVNYITDTQILRLQRHNPVFQWNKYEALLGISMFLDYHEMLLTIKHRIEKDTRYWKEDNFVKLYGCTINERIADLFERYSDREKFMKSIRENTELPKVARLSNAQIYLYRDIYKPDRRPWLLRKLFPR